EIAQKAPARFDTYADRIPDLIEGLDDDLAVARSFLTDAYEPFRARVLRAENLEFKGKNVSDACADPEWLAAEVSVVALKLDFNPADVNAALKRVSTLQAMFRQKLVPRR